SARGGSLDAARTVDRVVAAVNAARDEIVEYTRALVRLPTVNPPGEGYEDCARFIGADLERRGFAVEYIEAEGRPEHTRRHPRVNVVGTRRGGPGPLRPLDGHLGGAPRRSPPPAAAGRSIRSRRSSATGESTGAACAT